MGAAVYHHTPNVGLADLLLDHTGRPAAPTIRHGRPDAAALETTHPCHARCARPTHP